MLQERPPFVRFEYIECGVDEAASAASGRTVPLVKPHALIMQHGSKDVTEKNADEWLAHLAAQAREGRYRTEWLAMFKLQYEEWQKGNELPREGTPVKTWAALNREQAIRLTAMGITTVEDLAAMPDNGLGNIGMDGRYLRDLAKNYMASGAKGVDVKRLTDLEQQNREQADTIKQLSDRLAALEKPQKGKSAPI
jgi:hypothetical protein